MRSIIVAAIALTLSGPALAQILPPAVQQQIDIQQQQQQQTQTMYQQSQLQRQQQILDHAVGQQQNLDATANNRANLAREGALAQPLDLSESARAKALVDRAAGAGSAAVADGPRPFIQPFAGRP